MLGKNLSGLERSKEGGKGMLYARKSVITGI